MRDFRAREQRRRRVGTSRHARTAADAGRSVHGELGVLLWSQDHVAVRRAAGRRRYETARRDDAIERAAVDHQIFDHRKRARAPWFEIEHVAVVELAHVNLTDGGAATRAVPHPVDHEAAQPPDPFAEIAVEAYGLFALQSHLFTALVHLCHIR